MPGVKRIMISLPESLLDEVDHLVLLENKNRSEFVREAMRLYITERQRRALREQMKQGYLEMANLNLALAREGFPVEDEVLKLYEERLAECK